MILAIILVLGGVIRLANLTQSPPGFNQDEAANAWNAWSILKTGKDQTGERWPLFSSRCHGGYSSILHFYWMMPFQMVGGMNILTTRLPFAVSGIITLALICYVGNRMFGRPVGLVAAGLMAVNPWHIQQCRWGHEASLCPLLVSLGLAAMIWARLPIIDTDEPPRPWRSILAGIVLGVSCYGYQAMRGFLPGFMALAILATFSAWWRQLKTRTGAAAIAGFAIAGLLVFGPLAYKHIAEPQRIGRQMTEAVWQPGDPWYRKLAAVADRYYGHFGPEFLFIHGNKVTTPSGVFSLAIEEPPAAGQFAWYTLPLFGAGIAWAVARWRRSRAARILAAAVLAYPLGDCVAACADMHVLRSLPGLPGLILLAACGAAASYRWLCARQVVFARAAVSVMAVAVVGLSGHFLYQMLVDYPRRTFIYHAFQTDFAEVCHWLRPRFGDYDTIFCTTETLNQPYAISLVLLNYDPAQWFRDEQDVDTSRRWDIHKRYGKWRFVYDANAAQKEYTEAVKQPGKRILLILRPQGASLDSRPVKQIVRPDGTAVMNVYEVNTGPR